MRHLHMRHQGLGGGVDELVERRLVPCHKPFGRLLALDLAQLLRVVASLGHRLRVLDLVFGRFGDHKALGVEPHAPGASGDLVEFAGAQLAHARAVEFGELGEHDRMDRHIDADAKGVGAADHRQQALLRELFDETAVARQHAGVVDAHAVAQQAL